MKIADILRTLSPDPKPLISELLETGLLDAILSVDAKTGALTWKPRPVEMFQETEGRTAEHQAALWNSKHAGKPAFAMRGRGGYFVGRLFGVRVYAHRVVFALTRGYSPAGLVDHINRDPSDNRPENLREATFEQNCQNRSPIKSAKSRYKGVSFHKLTGKWAARITVGHKRLQIGLFASEDAAARAFDTMASKFHGEFGVINLPVQQ